MSPDLQQVAATGAFAFLVAVVTAIVAPLVAARSDKSQREVAKMDLELAAQLGEVDADAAAELHRSVASRVETWHWRELHRSTTTLSFLWSSGPSFVLALGGGVYARVALAQRASATLGYLFLVLGGLGLLVGLGSWIAGLVSIGREERDRTAILGEKQQRRAEEQHKAALQVRYRQKQARAAKKDASKRTWRRPFSGKGT